MSPLESFFRLFFKEIAIISAPRDEGCRYKDVVFKKLIESKKEGMDLKKLQIDIEELTRGFEERSIFRETPKLVSLMIGKNLLTAKDYLRLKIPSELHERLILPFGEYTLEALLIHTMGVAFNSTQPQPFVRLSSFIEQIEKSVIEQSHLLKKPQEEVSEGDAPLHIKGKGFLLIGRELVEFLLERKVIGLESIESRGVVKKPGQGYIETNNVVVCNLDFSLLPIKLNLPMVCAPSDWKIKKVVREKAVKGGGAGKTMKVTDLRVGI